MANTLTYTGLDQAKAQELAQGLDDLLANYSVFYQNTRGYHWNIKGNKFFELHTKFEELYTDLFTKIDELAERILTLGHTPDHSFTSYVKKSEIVEKEDVSDGTKAVRDILAAFQVLLKKQRHLLHVSDEAGDEGTNALMSDYITEQEKLVWMYAAYLGE